MNIKRYGDPTYTPEEDTLLAQWFLSMQACGELRTTLVSGAHSFGGFFDFARRLPFLAYEADEKGIRCAAWGENFMGGMSFGLWIRPEHRATKGAVAFALEVYDRIFAAGVPVVVGLCKQPLLVPAHESLGYTVCGTIPALWDGEDVIVLALRPEAFRAATEHLRRMEAA